MSRNFIVATWEASRKRRRDLRQVEAKSAEDAVALVAARHILTEEGAVYEAWPATQPSCILRVTLQPRRPLGPFPSEAGRCAPSTAPNLG